MQTTQEFPDLKLARVLDAVLERFTTRKIKKPVTVRQWLALSVWGIQQHYTKWSKMNLGLSRGVLQSAILNLDEPDLAGEYAREIAGAYEDEIEEVASETAMSTATYLINEAGDWGEYFTDLPFVGLGKALVRAGTKAWSAADMQRTVDAICRDESSCRNDFVGIEDSGIWFL